MAKDNINEERKNGRRIFRRIKENVIELGGPEEAKENNKKAARLRSRKKLILFLAVILAAVIIVLVVYINSIKQYKGYKVLNTNETDYESNADYIEFGGNLLKYTSDGVSYINSNGNTEWTTGTDMRMPIAESSGNYAVVADKGGNTVYVFDTDGAISQVTMPYVICDIDVASQGAFAVVLESETTNYVNLYDRNGEIIYEMQTTIDKSGYPLDISISEDAEKLFTSYLYIEGVDTKINLAAYNFGEVGQNANADRIVGGYIFEDEIIAKVEFISNDVVAAFSDKRILIYDMKEKPSERAVIEYDGEAQSIFYSSDYVGVIEKNPNESEDNRNIIKIYDTNGNLESEYKFNINYDKIYAAGKEIIITGGTECLILTVSGHVRFSYTFDFQIKSMIPSSGYREYIITFDKRTDKIKLK